MRPRPRIAIPVPTSFDTPYNQQSWPEYAAAIEESGGEPVRLELTRAIGLGRFDGILLPGSGADVAPALYGQEVEPETAPADELRHAVDKELLWQVDRAQIPLLAICFGLQSLNVHRGGTLVQHLNPVPVNHRAGRPVREAHSVLIDAESRLGRLAGLASAEMEGRRMINSSHHQAVLATGEGLRAVARSAEDGVIEALEDAEHRWMLGTQWHPERTFADPLSRAIFDSFVGAASDSASRTV